MRHRALRDWQAALSVLTLAGVLQLREPVYNQRISADRRLVSDDRQAAAWRMTTDAAGQSKVSCSPTMAGAAIA